jgi:FkbM family methyltransferase
MHHFYQYIVNIFIRYELTILNKIFYKILIYFLTEKIILNFNQCKFFAYPDKKDLSRSMIRNLRISDDEAVNFIISNLKKDNSIFIDIGCNYGAFSIPISKLKNNLDIFCFDPSRKSLNKLIENIKLNDLRNIMYFELGIGERTKTVLFNDNLDNYKNSGSYQIDNLKEGYKINVDSIDNLIEKKIIKPKENIFIKIDIEGYEFYALNGLTKTIKNYNVMILFEFSKKILQNHYNLEEKLLNFLDDNNLRIYNLKFVEQNVKNLFLEINKLKKEHDVLGNFILCQTIDK